MAKNKNKKKENLAAKMSNKVSTPKVVETKSVAPVEEKKVETQVEATKAENKTPEVKVETPKVEQPKEVETPKPEEKKETPKKETPIKETIKASPKETPKATSKPEQKVEEVKVEEVIDTKPIVKVNPVQTGLVQGLGHLANGERISADSAIAMAGLIERNYKHNPAATPVMANAMNKAFDIIMINSVVAWNNQFKNDMSEKGIKVSPEMFNAMSESFETYLGMELKALPTPDGQTMIDFEESVKAAPVEAKEVIKAEKKVKIITEIPTYTEGKTEEEYLADIKSILSMKNGMEANLFNSVTYAKKAFNLPDDAEPAQALAMMLVKFSESPSLLLTGFANALRGNLVSSDTPFTMQCWAKDKMPQFKDNQINNLVKVFLSYSFKKQAEKVNGDYKKNFLTPYSNLLSMCSDDIINKIIASKNSKEKKNVVFPKVEGLVDTGGIPVLKVVNSIKKTYGSELSDKLLKKKMQEIASIYTSPISPLEFYTEKSAYAVKK